LKGWSKLLRFKADDILNKSGVPTNYGNFNT
jgi:hypothetical protein